jgi:hypothetical protein
VTIDPANLVRRPMKFDAERALAQLPLFDLIRQAGTGQRRHAVQGVESQFHLAGHRYDRHPVVGSRFPTLIAAQCEWAAFGLWMVFFAHHDVLLARRIGSALIGALCLIAIVRGWFRFGRSWRPRISSFNVSWHRPSGARVRVVVLTHLDDTGRLMSAASRSALTALIAWLGAILILLDIGGPDAWGSRPAAALMIALLGIIAVRAFDDAGSLPGHAPSHPGGRDNEMALALLIELARTWPARLAERVEARFVAVGASGIDSVGARALARQILEGWPAKPTLVLILEAGAPDPRLALAGRGPVLELAEAAVKDLWIPHRRAPRATLTTDPRLFERRGMPCLGLIVPGRSPRRPYSPATLTAAAQLVTEIALRWARRTTPPAQDDGSAARSSQKPG